MSYKVNYYKLAIMEDGHLGNISQGAGYIFTDKTIQEIPAMLNEYLKKDKCAGVITKVEDLGGVCIN